MPLFGSRMPYQPTSQRVAGRLLKNHRADTGRAQQLIASHRDELVAVIELCVASGVGFLVSPTSDGGALSVTVYAGDKRERDYAGNPDEWGALLDAVRDFAEASLYEGAKETPKVAQRPAS